MCFSLFHRKDKAAEGRKDVTSTLSERSAPVAATAEPSPKPVDKERQKRLEEEIFEDGMPA